MTSKTDPNCDISSFLSPFAGVISAPLRLYSGPRLIRTFPEDEPLPGEAALSLIRDLLSEKQEVVSYLTTEDYLYLGAVRSKKSGETVIVGPVGNCPIYRFFNILSLLHLEMNHEVVDLMSTLKVYDPEMEDAVAKKNADLLYQRKESERYRATYLFEQTFYSYVQRGDVAGLQEFMNSVPPVTEGTIASDPLRQAKNIFISSIAILTRHAVAGGLDAETAYLLSDSYIQEAERMKDPAAITFLNATAAMDFTKRVSDSKIPEDMSPDIFKAIQYISNHVNRPISVEEIAEFLGMERSTLSKKFKRELGFNISAFIMRKKLEEARSLLRYSDRSISEISEYLCFSTQSYFQNVFKRKYGMTPKEYRKSVK